MRRFTETRERFDDSNYQIDDDSLSEVSSGSQRVFDDDPTFYDTAGHEQSLQNSSKIFAKQTTITPRYKDTFDTMRIQTNLEEETTNEMLSHVLKLRNLGIEKDAEKTQNIIKCKLPSHNTFETEQSSTRLYHERNRGSDPGYSPLQDSHSFPSCGRGSLSPRHNSDDSYSPTIIWHNGRRFRQVLDSDPEIQRRTVTPPYGAIFPPNPPYLHKPLPPSLNIISPSPTMSLTNREKTNTPNMHSSKSGTKPPFLRSLSPSVTVYSLSNSSRSSPWSPLLSPLPFALLSDAASPLPPLRTPTLLRRKNLLPPLDITGRFSSSGESADGATPEKMNLFINNHPPKPMLEPRSPLIFENNEADLIKSTSCREKAAISKKKKTSLRSKTKTATTEYEDGPKCLNDLVPKRGNVDTKTKPRKKSSSTVAGRNSPPNWTMNAKKMSVMETAHGGIDQKDHQKNKPKKRSSSSRVKAAYLQGDSSRGSKEGMESNNSFCASIASSVDAAPPSPRMRKRKSALAVCPDGPNDTNMCFPEIELNSAPISKGGQETTFSNWKSERNEPTGKVKKRSSHSNQPKMISESVPEYADEAAMSTTENLSWKIKRFFQRSHND